MTTKLPLILGLAAILACIALSSCAQLAGLSLAFDPEGNATFQLPPRVVIPSK